VVREGMREVDISAILEAEGRKAGHQGYVRMRGFNQEAMNISVTHGRSATIPSWGNVPIAGVGITHAIAQGPSLSKVKRGIPVLIDYCSGYNGYTTDETRTFVVGKLKERFRKPYEVARQIIEEAMVYGREGLDGAELFNHALQIAKKAGLEEYFMGCGPGKVSFIGHGLGLELNELPVITPRHHITLREGMVFAFEPKFIFPGEGAVGIEVDFVVGQKGLNRITTSPIDTV
jgi:Xaa-Pro aminopeptidase